MDRRTHDLHKTRRELIFRCPPDGALQVAPRLSIVELNRSQSACIEQPSNRLRLVDSALEGGFGDKLVGLVVLMLC